MKFVGAARQAYRPLARSKAASVSVALGLALLVTNLTYFHSIVDDAYISFRYLDNWLGGIGLVYNAGERVEGYTNFLWIVLLAPIRMLGVAPESAAVGAALVALLAALWAVFGTTTRLASDDRTGWMAVLLAAGSVPLARWAVSGMETVAFASFLALAARGLVGGGRPTLLTSVWFGLATLTRPEGVLHAAVAFGSALVLNPSVRTKPWRSLVAPGLAYAAFPLAHLIFRLLYYGSALPNTFYAKATGSAPGQWWFGLSYVWAFLVGGGLVLAVGAWLGAASKRHWNWVYVTLWLQVLVHVAYVIRVGGDFFVFGRFLVPVVPALAVLSAIGWSLALRAFRPFTHVNPVAVVLILSVIQSGLAYVSPARRSYLALVPFRNEHELVARWLLSILPKETTLAVNVAGRIPYRTRFPTIDMLGLNDAHIARTEMRQSEYGGWSTIGHMKHDGRYVCGRAPGAVLTSDGSLHLARTAREARFQAAINNMAGDREFLNAEGCRDRYRPVTAELRPGRYAVVYLRAEPETSTADDAALPATAEGWFQKGVEEMGNARFEEAANAFRASLRLNPGHPGTMANLGYCLLDLKRYGEAVETFEAVLEISPGDHFALYGLAQGHQRMGDLDAAVRYWRRYVKEAPDSPWKTRAKEHLLRLGARE